jgi:nucleotide-binding universal stress UspA family protein
MERKMYERIMVPLDGSRLAEVVLPYTEELAAKLGSEIILLSVAESMESEEYHRHQISIERVVEATRQHAERYLDKSQARPIVIRPVVVVGHPAEQIVGYAEKQDIDLIIMSTHGRSGIGLWALGSMANKVVRAIERPVVLIRTRGARPDVREKDIWDRMLVSLDGSTESEAVLPYVTELAARLKAEITLLRALPVHFHHLYADAEGYLQQVAGDIEARGVTVRIEIRVGGAAEEIVRMADQSQADVVAMSTHGRSGLTRWALGSVAEKVLHAGNTPLLLVRPR